MLTRTKKKNASNYLNESIAFTKTLDADIKYANRKFHTPNQLLFLRHDRINKDSAAILTKSLMKQDLPLNKTHFNHGWLYSIEGYEFTSKKKNMKRSTTGLQERKIFFRKTNKMTNVDSYVSNRK